MENYNNVIFAGLLMVEIQVSWIADRRFTLWATREAPKPLKIVNHYVVHL